ncbi:hypothetical protein [Vampirovibrio sp.]|uniref:hypothetical protein n=1 Tax=Vampirovibrio sp. TaxID=2717857 RepID=UPI0035940748
MRDIAIEWAVAPFAITHALSLSAADVALALEESNRESRWTGTGCIFSDWEPVALDELAAFHRQAFLWRFLKDRPQLLLGAGMNPSISLAEGQSP